MNHAPVELGTILFTLVEPHQGHEVAYNRWYERDHTKLYRSLGGAFRDEDGVPPELALDHGYAGLVAVFGEAREGVDNAEVARWYGEEHFPRALAGSSAAMCLVFRPVPIPDD